MFKVEDLLGALAMIAVEMGEGGDVDLLVAVEASSFTRMSAKSNSARRPFSSSIRQVSAFPMGKKRTRCIASLPEI
jgi:hypothetical protein